MKRAPIPKNEPERLKALKKLSLLDTMTEVRFDQITKAAAESLNMPISTISLIDEEREWFKSCQGLSVNEDSRETSFCGHAMLAKKILIIEDTKKDPRFADNPHVTKEGIRFYAGVALREKASHLPIGVLCVKDYKPRKFSPEEVALLIQLADKAEKELNKK